MLSLRALILPAVLLVSACAQAQASDARQGGQVEVPDFHGVSVSHGIRAEVKPGPKSVRLEGDADSLSRVKLEVEDGVLRTKVERDGWFTSTSLKQVRLYVTNPRVESLAASGGSKVDAEATAADDFEVKASGGSQVRVSGLDVEELEVKASGGAELTLEGLARELEVKASGGAVIDARDVRADSLDVSASGGTRVLAHPSKSLEGSLSGGSTVKVSRKPERTEVSASGGSKVVVE